MNYNEDLLGQTNLSRPRASTRPKDRIASAAFSSLQGADVVHPFHVDPVTNYMLAHKTYLHDPDPQSSRATADLNNVIRGWFVNSIDLSDRKNCIILCNEGIIAFGFAHDDEAIVLEVDERGIEKNPLGDYIEEGTEPGELHSGREDEATQDVKSTNVVDKHKRAEQAAEAMRGRRSQEEGPDGSSRVNHDPIAVANSTPRNIQEEDFIRAYMDKVLEQAWAKGHKPRIRKLDVGNRHTFAHANGFDGLDYKQDYYVLALRFDGVSGKTGFGFICARNYAFAPDGSPNSIFPVPSKMYVPLRSIRVKDGISQHRLTRAKHKDYWGESGVTFVKYNDVPIPGWNPREPIPRTAPKPLAGGEITANGLAGVDAKHIVDPAMLNAGSSASTNVFQPTTLSSHPSVSIRGAGGPQMVRMAQPIKRCRQERSSQEDEDMVRKVASREVHKQTLAIDARGRAEVVPGKQLPSSLPNMSETEYLRREQQRQQEHQQAREQHLQQWMYNDPRNIRGPQMMSRVQRTTGVLQQPLHMADAGQQRLVHLPRTEGQQIHQSVRPSIARLQATRQQEGSTTASRDTLAASGPQPVRTITGAESERKPRKRRRSSTGQERVQSTSTETPAVPNAHSMDDVQGSVLPNRPRRQAHHPAGWYARKVAEEADKLSSLEAER